MMDCTEHPEAVPEKVCDDYDTIDGNDEGQSADEGDEGTGSRGGFLNDNIHGCAGYVSPPLMARSMARD